MCVNHLLLLTCQQPVWWESFFLVSERSLYVPRDIKLRFSYSNATWFEFNNKKNILVICKQAFPSNISNNECTWIQGRKNIMFRLNHTYDNIWYKSVRQIEIIKFDVCNIVDDSWEKISCFATFVLCLIPCSTQPLYALWKLVFLSKSHSPAAFCRLFSKTLLWLSFALLVLIP